VVGQQRSIVEPTVHASITHDERLLGVSFAVALNADNLGGDVARDSAPRRCLKSRQLVVCEAAWTRWRQRPTLPRSCHTLHDHAVQAGSRKHQKHTCGPLSGTTHMSRYQKGKTNLDVTEARDSEWQWHQLGRMQVCTSLQANSDASTPPLSFYRPDALPATQPTVSKH